MRYTVPHRWTLVAFSVLLVGLVGWPAPSGAQISTGITVVLGGTGNLGGTPGALHASALAGEIPGLLTGRVLHATTIGYPGQVDSDVSIANVALDIAGNTVDVHFVMARAKSVLGAAGTGSAAIINLVIDGVPIVVSGAPNQTITIPGGRVVINEVVRKSPTGIVVHALHVTVPGAADVIIGSATADASTITGHASAVRATGL